MFIDTFNEIIYLYYILFIYVSHQIKIINQYLSSKNQIKSFKFIKLNHKIVNYYFSTKMLFTLT